MSVLDVDIMPISLKVCMPLFTFFHGNFGISTLVSVPIVFFKVLAVIVVVGLNHPWDPCQGLIPKILGEWSHINKFLSIQIYNVVFLITLNIKLHVYFSFWGIKYTYGIYVFMTIQFIYPSQCSNCAWELQLFI